MKGDSEPSTVISMDGFTSLKILSYIWNPLALGTTNPRALLPMRMEEAGRKEVVPFSVWTIPSRLGGCVG